MADGYAINEIFATLQGEGQLAGTPAIFVRFSGCNLWTGRPEHRERDAERHAASCPRWCDTDFATRERLSPDAIVARAAEAARQAAMPAIPLVVFTGGEPLLQLDAPLAQAMLALPGEPRLAIETNGLLAPSPALAALLGWICVSPKTGPERLKLRAGDELKVVYPGGHAEPEAYAEALDRFAHYLVSPLAQTEVAAAGRSQLSRDNMQAAARYCLAHPRWRLTTQQHKLVGLR